MDQNFWKRRVEKYGHTGWASNAIYEFDQPIRLRIVDMLMAKYIHVSGGVMLDFGCGSGEFSRFLGGRFDQIVLYDTCEEVMELALKDMPDAISITDINCLRDTEFSYKAVLSITVLQHILDDAELDSVIKFIANRLSDYGVLIVMEQFHQKDTGYTRNWRASEFISLMEKSGLNLVEAYNFYENGIMNDPIFKSYKFRPDVFFFSHVEAYLPKTRKLFHPIYHRICERKKLDADVERFLFPFTEKSGDKFMVFRKSNET